MKDFDSSGLRPKPSSIVDVSRYLFLVYFQQNSLGFHSFLLPQVVNRISSLGHRQTLLDLRNVSGSPLSSISSSY